MDAEAHPGSWPELSSEVWRWEMPAPQHAGLSRSLDSSERVIRRCSERFCWQHRGVLSELRSQKVLAGNINGETKAPDNRGFSPRLRYQHDFVLLRFCFVYTKVRRHNSVGEKAGAGKTWYITAHV